MGDGSGDKGRRAESVVRRHVRRFALFVVRVRWTAGELELYTFRPQHHTPFFSNRQTFHQRIANILSGRSVGKLVGAISKLFLQPSSCIRPPSLTAPQFRIGVVNQRIDLSGIVGKLTNKDLFELCNRQALRYWPDRSWASLLSMHGICFANCDR